MDNKCVSEVFESACKYDSILKILLSDQIIKYLSLPTANILAGDART